MKKLFYTSIAFIALLLNNNNADAQPSTYTGPPMGSFHTASHWSTGIVPAQDSTAYIIIPEGLSVVNDGDIVLRQGYIYGPGTFINNGTLLIISPNSSFNVAFNLGMTFQNNGMLELDYVGEQFTSGQISMGNGGSIVNSASGTIRFDDMGINGPTTRITNNGGTIIKDGPEDIWMLVRLTMNGGTLHVQDGIMNLSHYLYPDTNYFNSGTYNVDEGATFELTSLTKISGSLSGNVLGDWYGAVNYTCENTADLDFSGNGISLHIGQVKGGGVITNNGTFNFTNSGTSTSKTLNDGTTFINNGITNFNSGPSPSGYNLNLVDDAIFQNESTGVVNFSSFGISSGGTDPGLFINNGGVINRPVSTNEFIIVNTPMEINGGEINADANLYFQTATTTAINSCTFNVAEDVTIRLQDSIQWSGTLNGMNNGKILLFTSRNIINTELINAVEGNGLEMTEGHIIGNGELINTTQFLFSGQYWKVIKGAFQFRNQGTLEIDNTGQGLSFRDSTVLMNEANGTILLRNYGYIFSEEHTGALMNYGTILSDDGNFSYIKMATENFGTIDVGNGQIYILEAPFINHSNGLVTGNGTFRVDDWSLGSNNGTVSPGPGVQSLDIQNGFIQDENGILEIDITGLIPETEHDQINCYTGNVSLSGDIIVNLSYVPQIDDEFVVLTANGTVTCTDLSATTSAEYAGIVYTFDVICNSNNVTLKLASSSPVGLEDLAVEDIFRVYPNPSVSELHIDLNKDLLPSGESRLVMVNALGKIVRVVEVSKASSIITIERGDLSSGVYFLRVESGTVVSSAGKVVLL